MRKKSPSYFGLLGFPVHGGTAAGVYLGGHG